MTAPFNTLQETEINEKFEPQSASILADAKRYTITKDEDIQPAVNAITEIKKLKGAIVAFFKEPKDLAHKAWKSVCEREKFFTVNLDESERIYKNKLETFQRAEQARRDAAAEEERRKLETQKKRFETAGNIPVATAYAERAEAVTAGKTILAAPGLTSRKLWRASVSDMEAFLIAASKNLALRAFITVDTNALARTYGGKEIAIPGVDLEQVTNFAVRA